MTNYATDREWSDKYLPQVSEILRANAMHIVKVAIADNDVDCREATDMTVDVTGGQVAVRVRRPYMHYRDLTIRSWRASGAKTEIHKLRDGFGDWYLYGWTNGQNQIGEWILVDLDKVREAGLLDSPRKEIPNSDRRTRFVAIGIPELERSGCIVSKRMVQQSLIAGGGLGDTRT